MKKNIVLPFRTLSTDSKAISINPWINIGREGGHSEIDFSRGIDGWAYNVPLAFSRQYSFDPKLIREEIGLEGVDCNFSLVTSVKIGDLGIRRRLKNNIVSGSTIQDIECYVKLDSNNICQKITLVSSLVLAESLDNTPAYAPSQKGARLWAEEVTIRLDGGIEGFPISDVDFNMHHRLPSDADWYLQWQPNLAHYSFNSTVLLLLNSAKKDFVEMLQKEDAVLVRNLMGDIVCEMSIHLLMKDSFVEKEDPFPEGSMGDVVMSWLNQAYPGESVSGIRQRYFRSPSEVSSCLRSKVAVF